MKIVITAAACLAASLVQAATVPLASVMNPSSFLSESTATGGFARISLGDGSLGSVGANTGDADGIYNVANIDAADPGSTFGTPIDVFPREANFQVGSLETAPISGSGLETVGIVSLDTSEFWTSDPARTDFTNFSAPTVISDISDYGIGVWFFNGPGSIDFGPLDAGDTVTFLNGEPASIDLEVEATFAADAFGTPVSYTGTFSVSGNQLALQIDDTAPLGFFGDSVFVADLNGTVTAVVPEPGGVAFLLSVALVVPNMRRR
ncbi:MAG: hypothetical protein AAGJ46_13420 [Planctomycetota bacterium]